MCGCDGYSRSASCQYPQSFSPQINLGLRSSSPNWQLILTRWFLETMERLGKCWMAIVEVFYLLWKVLLAFLTGHSVQEARHAKNVLCLEIFNWQIQLAGVLCSHLVVSEDFIRQFDVHRISATGVCEFSWVFAQAELANGNWSIEELTPEISSFVLCFSVRIWCPFLSLSSFVDLLSGRCET